MISLATVLGLASLGIAADALFDVFDQDAEIEGGDDHRTWDESEDTILAYAGEDGPGGAESFGPADPPIELGRGAVIEDFDPETDGIEIEYLAALPPPDISVALSSDGDGTDISFDGVVVATVQGAQGLTADHVRLVPV